MSNAARERGEEIETNSKVMNYHDYCSKNETKLEDFKTIYFYIYIYPPDSQESDGSNNT